MQQAIALIKIFEGFSSIAYADPVSGNDPWTIGYGTTRYRNGRSVVPGDTITEQIAASYLQEECDRIIATLNRTIPRWEMLEQNQQSAIASFAYNLGEHFYESEGFDSITQMLKTGDIRDAARIFGLYTNQGVPGLVTRRKKEAELFLKDLPMKAEILRSTIAKQSTVQAKDLRPEHKTELKPGGYEIDRWEFAANGHQRVTFKNAIAGHFAWVIWGDDVVCTGEQETILLKVPYYSQRDNRNQSDRTCNTSACVMAAEFIKPGSCHQSDDWFWENCLNPEGDSTDHAAMTRALNRVGIKSEFFYNLEYSDINKELEAGRPLVLGLLHRGTLANPSGGHMVCCIGRYADGYVFNDSWGAGMEYTSPNGKEVKYPRKSLDSRWLADGQGWGRIFKN